MAKKPFLVEYYHTVGDFELDQTTTQYFAVVLADSAEEAENQLEEYMDIYFLEGFTSGFKAVPFTDSMMLSSIACYSILRESYPKGYKF